MNLIYVAEAAVGAAFHIIVELRTMIDIDYMLCILLIPWVHLVLKVITKKQLGLLGLFVYDI